MESDLDCGRLAKVRQLGLTLLLAHTTQKSGRLFTPDSGAFIVVVGVVVTAAAIGVAKAPVTNPSGTSSIVSVLTFGNTPP